MLFTSPAFLVFFLAYLALHLVLPLRRRLLLIVAGSTVFYAWWKVADVWVPFLLFAIAHGGVLWMGRATDDSGRRRRAALALVALFAPLAVFKYADFARRDLLGPLLGGGAGDSLGPSLPLGISFVTFTLTAYVADVLARRLPDGQRASSVLAYVLFFPHLIAGPILRPRELIPQLERPRRFTPRALAPGMALFTLGLVKKLVVADPLGVVVDPVFVPGATLSGPAALLGIYGFAAQIYCDFSGYTDMAVGLALLLGVRLPENFRQPYASASPAEFWRRWHRTLSFWLRDYLYKPLGGRHGGRAREVRNVMITMLLGGLWHGAGWRFVLWGAIHGAAVSAAHLLSAPRGRAGRLLPRAVAVVLTFHFVALAWLPFRAPSLAQAGRVLAAALGGDWPDPGGFLVGHTFPLVLLAVFFATHRLDDQRRVRIAARRLPPEILWPILTSLWLTALAVSQGSSAKFIYFDF